MITELWVFAALGLLAVLHLGLVAYWSHRRTTGAGERADAGSSGGAGVAPADDGEVVQCPECGTANSAEYRYCQACVAEIGSPDRMPGRPSSGRGVF